MKAKIGNRSCEVEMISKDGNRVEISVDGKIYDIDVVMSESGFVPFFMKGVPTMQRRFVMLKGNIPSPPISGILISNFPIPKKEICKGTTIGNGRGTGDHYLSHAGQGH